MPEAPLHPSPDWSDGGKGLDAHAMPRIAILDKMTCSSVTLCTTP